MPRAKRASDEIYNERRRARRLAARLERDQSGTAMERIARKSYAESIRELAEKTKIGRPSKSVKSARARSVAEAVKSLQAATSKYRGAAQVDAVTRSNDFFARQMRIAATKGKKSAIYGLNREEVNIFYTATKDIWRTTAPNKRLEAVLSANIIDDGMGGKRKPESLEEAFRYVMSRNVEALNEAQRWREEMGLETDTDKGMRDESGDNMPYDRYLYFVDMI